MSNNYINKDLIIDIIEANDMAEQQLFINLYHTYDLINQNYELDTSRSSLLYGKIDKKNLKRLEELENSIYMINGRELTQRERIMLEYDSITRFCEKNKKTIPDQIETEVKGELTLLEAVIKRADFSEPRIIEYIKKHISIIQAYLGLSIKFFSSAIIALYDEIINQALQHNIDLDLPQHRIDFESPGEDTEGIGMGRR